MILIHRLYGFVCAQSCKLTGRKKAQNKIRAVVLPMCLWFVWRVVVHYVTQNLYSKEPQ
jgi:hypothetical protein